MMILSVLLFAISLIVYAAFLRKRLDCALSMQHALLVVSGACLMWGVLCGVLNLLWLGTLLYYLGVPVLLFFLLRKRESRASLTMDMTSFPVCAFLFGVLFFLILFSCRPPFFINWDEYSHWGIFLKNVKLTNALHIYGDKIQVHPSYLQGMTAFYYIGSFFEKTYSEVGAYLVYNVLLIVSTLSVFPSLSWKKNLPMAICCLLSAPIFLYILPHTEYAAPYTSVYLDLLVGVYFGAILLFILQNRETCHRWYIQLSCGILLFALLQIKDISIAFVMICIATYLAELFLSERKQKGFRWKRWAIALLCVCLLPMLGKLLWSVSIHLTGKDLDQFNQVSLSHILELIRADRSGENNYFSQVFHAYVNGILHVKVSWTNIPFLGIVLLLFGCCFAAGWIERKKSGNLSLISHSLFFLLYTFCYLVLLLVIYMCGMSFGEAMSNASMDRYLGSFLAGWSLVALWLVIDQTQKHLSRIAFAVPLAVTVLILTCILPKSMYVTVSPENSGKNYYERRTQAALQALPSESRVWVVQYGGDPSVFEKYLRYYYFFPNTMQWEWPIDVSGLSYSDMRSYARENDIDYVVVFRDPSVFYTAYQAELPEEELLINDEACLVWKLGK